MSVKPEESGWYWVFDIDGDMIDTYYNKSNRRWEDKGECLPVRYMKKEFGRIGYIKQPTYEVCGE